MYIQISTLLKIMVNWLIVSHAKCITNSLWEDVSNSFKKLTSNLRRKLDFRMLFRRIANFYVLFKASKESLAVVNHLFHAPHHQQGFTKLWNSCLFERCQICIHCYCPTLSTIMTLRRKLSCQFFNDVPKDNSFWCGLRGSETL